MTRLTSHFDSRFSALLLLCTALAWHGALAQEPPATQQPDWANMRLMLAFQGKGSCLPFDAGVLHEAYARIPALRSQQVVVSGNSSGAIMAAYFGCYGFTDESVRFAEHKLITGDRSAVRNMENPNSKVAKLLRGRRTEISHEELREYIAFALGVNPWRGLSIQQIVQRSRAVPRFPMIIVACNKEVLEDRQPDSKLPVARGYKQLHLDDLTVAWSPEVHQFYLDHSRQFAQEQPDLRLGSDAKIGHAVTYFVDPSMYALLSQIPPQQRTADLRLVTTPADLALAIIASAAEPTYFDPVLEPDPTKLLTWMQPGDLGNVRRRTYYGGYLVPLPAQDVRRMLPGIRVLGTGLAHHPLEVRKLMTDWLLADCEVVAQHNEWWADMQTTPSAEFYSHMVFRDLTAQQEYQAGREHADACFDHDSGLPPFVRPPKYNTPAKAAIAPAFDAPDMLDADGRLRTLRGLGPLLSQSLVSSDRPSVTVSVRK